MLPPNTTVINYKYDALGRRVERSKANGTWTRYGYDGLEVLRDVSSDGSTVEYVNGDELDDHLWQRKSDGTTQYFLTDHQGSTRGLTDGSGAVTASYSYDTFGNGFSSSLTRFGYTGREHDAETGLLYYRARWYDPTTGRFVSEDPIGLAGGINLYAYVKGDPLNLRDALGLAPGTLEKKKKQPPPNPDGKRGGPLVRLLNDIVGLVLEEYGWTVIKGAFDLPEEYFVTYRKGRKSTCWVDVTAKRMVNGCEEFIRVQTVDTYADWTPDKRELDNLWRIALNFRGTRNSRRWVPKNIIMQFAEGVAKGFLDDAIEQAIPDIIDQVHDYLDLDRASNHTRK